MKRAKHSLNHYRLTTGNMGELLALPAIPVLPGDTFRHQTSIMIRVSPLNTPVMHPVAVRVHSFFVPNRITFPGWEDFITGGEDGNSSELIPTIQTTATKKTLLTALGCPPIPGIEVSALPVYAANAIYNEYYRDQDILTKRLNTDITNPLCAWEKDYFSTSRPWSQKGPSVSLPLGSRAPVAAGPGVSDNGNVYVGDSDDGRDNWGRGLDKNGTSFVRYGSLAQVTPNLFADLGQATAASVNDFRAAFSLQRYQEARARYGARFTEYLRYLGITPSDARLQRPEYLGGGSGRVNFSEVLQTTETLEQNKAGVGDLYGHGIAGLRTRPYQRFFEEHGYVITFISVRPKSIYLNGVPREWQKTTKEDFFQKELANLGQQEVWQSELYGENVKSTFGYQDRYHEYRSINSSVGNDFRDTLNAWHLGRDLQAGVALNPEFIECKPSDRIFQVGTSTADSLWIMANQRIAARRMVPKRANPRIL